MCPSHAGIVSNWLNAESRKQHHTIARGLWFSDAKDLGEIRTKSPQTGVPNAGGKVTIGSFCSHTDTHTTVLWLSEFFLGQPRWADIRRNIHPLTFIVIINHPLSASSICYNSWHHPCSIYMPNTLFLFVSQVFLVYLLARHPPLHTPYISPPNNCLLFTAHAHTITTCFAIVLRLCHLIRVSLSTLNLELCLVA